MMKKFSTPFVVVLIALTALVSCREDTLPVNNIPTANPITISNITPFSADAYGYVTQTSGVAEYGFIVGTTSDFSYPDTIKCPVEKQSGNTFSATITGLNPNTTYLCATYVKSAFGNVIYSLAKGFSTLQLDPNKTIYYTSTDYQIVTPRETDAFGANILYNIYRNNQGMIVFDEDVTSIGELAFYKCNSLKSVSIGNGVTSIRRYAFYGCSNLKSFTIPDSVTSIGPYAFEGCSSLASVYCKPTTPPTGSSYMFASNASGRKIYVPTESVEAYKTAEGWSKYAHAIVGYEF